MNLVFDIEADNLLPKLSKFHCAGAIDLDTNKEYWFGPDQAQDFLKLLDKADLIIAHNAFGYDVPALTKLFGWKPKAKVQCTKVMSQVLNYRRFGFGHSLKLWGQKLNDFKGDYTGGFEEYNQDMFEYMKQDVRLLKKVYSALMKELKRFIGMTKSKEILKALRSEMDMDAVMAEQISNGWLFNRAEAEKLLVTIEQDMNTYSQLVNPHLGMKVKKLDTEPKTPKFTKSGKYHAHIARYFELGPECGVDDRPVWGDYNRIEFIAGDIGNTDTVKRYLYTIGWKPDEWNWKKIDGKFVKISAKLTDSSLGGLGDVGDALSKYYTLRSRKSILEGWFDHVDKDSRLHGDVFNIGTPTFRQTHKIIANLPSGKAVLGPEFRKLFIAKEGYKLVSADSAACQLRLLAHFMQDPTYTDTVLHGDVHQKNADIVGCSRAIAKPFIFAFLYGAGGKKLGSILGVSDAEGNKLKKKFTDANPSLKRLINKVGTIVENQGYILGLDDRPIHVESQHKALNYLIQGAEATVMKYTVNMIHKELEKADIDSSILLFYHDEVTYEVREDQAKQAREIIMRCFSNAPKELGVDIMECGDCKIGDNYFDVH